MLLFKTQGSLMAVERARPDTNLMPEKSTYRIVLLGTGRSVTGSLPSAKVSIDERDRLIDWLLASFTAIPSPEILFVVGYKAAEVETRYPDIRFLFNPNWAETGPASSLSLAPISPAMTTYVAYSDVVWRPESVRRMEEIDMELVLAIDSRWQVRYDNRSRADVDATEKIRCADNRVVDISKRIATAEADAEFAGLFKVSGHAAKKLQEILRSPTLPAKAGVPELIRRLLAQGVRAAFVDVRGDWAELDAPQDLARFVLGTKAESLERLRPLIRRGRIGAQVSFSKRRWQADPTAVVARIRGAFGSSPLIVRSSALNEDSWLQSAAGAYKSILDVSVADSQRLTAAVDEVFRSYGKAEAGDQVLVQEMLRDVAMSGVVMTRTSLGAPYYVINFDHATARTDTVTSGESDSLCTLYLHRGAALRTRLPPQLCELMAIIEELEQLVGHNSLDIEFAFTRDGNGHVLQVRPIAVANDQPVDDKEIASGLADAARTFQQLRKPSPFLLGCSTQLSVMTDWNPAEMIGTKPNRLAFSLYRHLITDAVWARQRAEYGYRDVRPHNLIVDLLGHPYVDVRVDFNSFIPAALPEELAARLVDHYLECLRRRPTLHDKVEFDVLVTCFGFDFAQRGQKLRRAGFSDREVALLGDALREITRRGITRCASDLASLKDLEHRFEAIITAGRQPLETAYLCLEDVRRIGMPAFAHLARNAFVAVSLLRSLEDRGLISVNQREDFLASVNTVPSAMKNDARRVDRGETTWGEFVHTYGHLRPGSYDITSPCYASAPEKFLRPALEALAAQKQEEPGDPWDDETRQVIDRQLAELDIGVGIYGFECFLRQAIEGREFGKFTFMRNVNAALEALAEFGAGYGLSRKDLSHLRIHEILELRGAQAQDPATFLQHHARLGREAWYVTQAVCLPGQILSETDLRCFEQRKAEPSFVTRKKARAEVASISGELAPEVAIDGKIVLIPNADPGFDWLFAREIAGLITMYGGVNSHMAIRAAELRLPAAIGVGILLYEKISLARCLELDCASRQIKIVC